MTMAKLTLRKYRFKATHTISFTNYAVLLATTVLVLITAHAKSTLLDDNNFESIAAASAMLANKNTNANANTSAPTAQQIASQVADTDTEIETEQMRTETLQPSPSQSVQQTPKFRKNKHFHNQRNQHKHRQHHHQHPHHFHHNEWEQRKHHYHHSRNQNMVSPYGSAIFKRPYHSKFTIEELLNTKFEHKISNDIDMDPCKAGGFMGDIALPDVNYSGDYPIVAHTVEWQPQSDAAASPEKTITKFNTTFQQELEILKQEVYHEGLQVEEEGLTHIIRKKTKLPNSNVEYNNERNRNDPTLSANEPVKPTGYSPGGSDYLMKNFKNEVINSVGTVGAVGAVGNSHQRRKINAASYPIDTEYYEPTTSLLEKSISVHGEDVLPTGAVGNHAIGNGIPQQKLNGNSNGNGNGNGNGYGQGEGGMMTRGGAATTFDANGKIESIAFHRTNGREWSGDGDATLSAGSSETEKPYKPLTGLHNRNVDQRKIQSNTKDIEDDSGNNFVAERKVVILPTSPPTLRSTLPNVYSNAGGNGMRLDDVEFLHAEGAVRRRHRRGRKNRRSSDIRSDYNAKLQRLKEELNRPVRTMSDYRTATNRYHQLMNKNEKKDTDFHTDNVHPKYPPDHDGDQQPQYHRQQQHLAKNFNYSSENSDELDVLTKRKSTMDAINGEVQSSFEMELDRVEDMENLKHHHRMARAVTAKKERVWDYGIIPFEIDGNFSGLHKALFKQAMRHWENYTCIKFVERDPEIHPNYIVFTVRSCGCCSFVGKRGNGPQAISIGRNCDKFGIVVHELGHVVGFWHEHTRPDREKHVVIELNNIMKGQDYNFNKLTPEEVDSLGLPYDYNSIMHYARNTFSKGTYLDTILPIEVKGKKRPEIGQRIRLSAGDIAQANLLYKCPKCGRTFQENTGIFATPSYYTAGALSNETEHCEWRITATHGERVVLRLENLNLLKSNNCETDYLEIRDGYYFKSPLIGRFCGKVNGEMLKTETSRMLLTYVNKHRSEGYRGFKAEFDVICGGELSVDDAEGRLESPNYPLEYLPNKECVWKINVPKGYQVALKFQSFEVENHDSCVYDFVEVRDGPTQNSPLIGVFCGYKAPPNMKSSGNSMFVKFVSDTSVQKAGFTAIFMKEVDECVTQNHGCEHECINTLGGYECSCHIGYELHSDKKHCEDACGGVIEYPNGTITSPSFPDMYPMLKDCIWEIIAPPKHKISLNFTHFDLEGTAHQQSDCGYDSVVIYSKLSENRLKRIGTYCGSAIPPTATSEGNALRIEFHSDKSVQRSGFAAVFFTDIDECSFNNGGCQHECRNTIGSYICSCHNGYSLHENGHDCKEGECKHEISAPFGTIYSPNYPDLYPPNSNCVWHFSTTPGHRIKLIFNEFSVESHQECAYDNVAIYDGDSEMSSILGRFCGDKIPYPISSSTNQLYMVFKTDKNKQMNGFTAIHSTSCGGYLRATNQIQQFYSHSRYGNHNYNENMDCEWTIQAPANSNVQLLFLTFDLESSENCTYDYVQVFSGMEDTSGPMYGQYCGNTLPQDIISLTDSLLVRFKTDSSITMKGFSASYVAVDPFSDEDINSYSAERVTPFPGSLKSIYEDSEDYSDFSENQLITRSRSRYQNGL